MAAPAPPSRAGIRAAIFDVDGVLTDGRLYIGEHGETVKAFCTLDGHGLKLLAQGAAHVILASGFTGTAVRAFMSTVILLGRPAVPNKVFSEPSAAAAWHLPLLAQGTEAWTAAEYAALVQQLAPT